MAKEKRKRIAVIGNKQKILTMREKISVSVKKSFRRQTQQHFFFFFLHYIHHYFGMTIVKVSSNGADSVMLQTMNVSSVKKSSSEDKSHLNPVEIVESVNCSVFIKYHIAKGLAKN